MPQYPPSYNRLRELEQRRSGSSSASRDYQRRYPANTLGPHEDILASRRRSHRNPVTIVGNSPRNSNVLLENLFILIFLAASIWGLYSLVIYLLTHS